MSASEFFQSLPHRTNASRLDGINNSYLFEIDGEGSWRVEVRNGSVTVSQSDGNADVTISTSSETFGRIVRREQNPASAYMRGKLKVKGDMGAAMKLQKLFG